MSTPPIETDIPPAGEDIHLPENSIQPFLLAFFIMIGLVGITTFWELWVIGSIGTAWVLFAWIRDARRELAALPLEHGHPDH